MNPILFVGSHSYDLAALTTVAARASDTLGRDVVVATVAPAEERERVRAQLTPTGIPILDRTVVRQPRLRRNPIRQARRWRADNEAVVDELIAAVRPAAVVSDVNPPPGLLLDGLARRGIPTILLQLWFWGDRAFQDAWRADDRRIRDAGRHPGERLRARTDELAARAVGIRPHVVWDVRHATVAVQGPGLRRRLVADGVPADHVVVTGNPVLDDLHRLAADPEPARRRVGDALRAAAGVPILTHFRSHEDRMVTLDAETRRDAQARVIRALSTAAPEARVVVKIHPKEGDAERALIHAIDPRVTVVGQEVETTDLVAASAITVGTFSTTLLQSVAVDRPTVAALLWPGLEYWRRATDWSGVDRVDSEEALTRAVRRHLGDPAYQADWAARREAFRRDELLVDGGGTDRVVALVDSMIRRRSTP